MYREGWTINIPDPLAHYCGDAGSGVSAQLQKQHWADTPATWKCYDVCI